MADYATQPLSVIWETIDGQQKNRRVNTTDKKSVFLYEEINRKKVIEEYIEEKMAPKNEYSDFQYDFGGQSQHPYIHQYPEQLRSDYQHSASVLQRQNDVIKEPEAAYQQMKPNFDQLRLNLGATAANQQDSGQQQKYKKPKLDLQKGGKKSGSALKTPPGKHEKPYFEEKSEDKKFGSHGINIGADYQGEGSSGSGDYKPGKIKSTSKPNFTVYEEDEESATPPKNTESSMKVITDVERQNTGGVQNSSLEMVNKQSGSKISIQYMSSLGPKIDSKKDLPAVIQTKKERKLSLIDGDQLIHSQQQTIDKTESIIIATFLLPFKIERNLQSGELMIEKCFNYPTMLNAALLNMIEKKQYNFKWVGLITTLEELSTIEKEALEIKFQDRNCFPIFMTAEELKPYLLFYENILRPLFHNFQDLYDLRTNFLSYWKDYDLVNRKVAQRVVEVARNEMKDSKAKYKTIWVHNNYLMMVPLYVKKSFERANIGFYFHSPFPSSESFRKLKQGYDIMKSLLHCDLIAFHIYLYADNFCKTCHRMCGFELEFIRGGYFAVNFHGKHIMIRIAHIGIEYSFIEEIIESQPFKMHRNKFKNAMTEVYQYQKKEMCLTEPPIIMSSIDSYHPICGLKNKLLSYQLFLRQYPSYLGKVVLIQFVESIVQAFDNAEDHKRNVDAIAQVRQDVQKLKEEIHQEFGQTSLIFQENNPPLEKRIALWSNTDIILCSSLKDGFCIQVLEYVALRKHFNMFSKSTMICSEFAGCNEAMRGVLRYNPFSLNGFVQTMDVALTLTSREKEEKMNLSYNYIKRNSTSKWTEEFLTDLKVAYQPTQAAYYLGLNFGAQSKTKNITGLMRLRQDFRKININNCHNSLLKANKCVILIEIEALPHLKFSKHSVPTLDVIEQLQGLLIDNRNTVIIIGNHSKSTLAEWFNTGFTNNGNQFWLAAESGQYYKAGSKEKWQNLTKDNDLSWIPTVKKIMQAYSDNIDGSFVEERESCVLWNYKNAESEHGTMFIHDLYNLIQKVLQGTKTDINYGNGYLEVKPQEIKKQKLVELLLQRASENRKIDFLFYLGNDSSDEPVYELLKSTKAGKNYFHPECSKYICVLEKKPSEADFYIEDLEQVQQLLDKLQNATKKRKKIRSFADLNVFNTGVNPLAGQSLKRDNKNAASIANLGQFMGLGNGLTENINSMSGQTPANFWPAKQIPKKQAMKQERQAKAAADLATKTVQEVLKEAGSAEDDDSAFLTIGKIPKAKKLGTPDVNRESNNENQEVVSTSNNEAMLFENGFQFSDTKIGERGEFFDAPLDIGSTGRHRQNIMNLEKTHSLSNEVHQQLLTGEEQENTEVLTQRKKISGDQDTDTEILNHDLDALDIDNSYQMDFVRGYKKHKQSAHLTNSFQKIADKDLIHMGPQSNIVTPHAQSVSKNQNYSNIGQQLKPQPLSAIGLIHPNGEYSALSELNQVQAQHSFGQPSQKRSPNEAIFKMEEGHFNPSNIQMGSLADSFGTSIADSSTQGQIQMMASDLKKVSITGQQPGDLRLQNQNSFKYSKAANQGSSGTSQPEQIKEQIKKVVSQPVTKVAQLSKPLPAASPPTKFGTDLAKVQSQTNQPPAQFLANQPQTAAGSKLAPPKAKLSSTKCSESNLSQQKLKQILNKDSGSNDEENDKFGSDNEINDI